MDTDIHVLTLSPALAGDSQSRVALAGVFQLLEAPCFALCTCVYMRVDVAMCCAQSRVALADVVELLEAAEAKAYYGLAINWAPLQALVTALLDRGVMQVCLTCDV